MNIYRHNHKSPHVRQKSAKPRSTKVEEKHWQWFGCAAHLIVGAQCRFHMATKIGDYLVSTVGEYWPERTSREIHARHHNPQWLRDNQHRKGDDFDHAYMLKFGYETIGCYRKYETMVFKTEDGECSCGCGLPLVSDFTELDFEPYNDAKAARAGHMMLCHKWSNPRKASKPPAADSVVDVTKSKPASE